MWHSKDVELFQKGSVNDFFCLKALFTLEQVNKKEPLWAKLQQNFDGESNWEGVINFHCSIQMSLVMSVCFFLGDDWNDAPCSSPFFYLTMTWFLLNQDPWFSCIETCALNQLWNKSLNMIWKVNILKNTWPPLKTWNYVVKTFQEDLGWSGNSYLIYWKLKLPLMAYQQI